MTASRRLLLLLPALALTRCGGKPPPPPPSLELTIACGPVINPDETGAPAPVAVRIYLLSAETRFQRADVFALTEREKATLGGDGAMAEELIVRPSSRQTLSPALKPDTHQLGVVVLFRDIDHAQWRAMAPIAANGPTRLTLKIETNSASLAPG
ncbi:MAG: type VI secretion system lipoprotein TssJ [Rhodospirillales bacterium]|nr:type VI secretion system lipoprotein TssJ [Rhodospirillales bacterium]